MKTATETIWPLVMAALDFEDDADLMAMHFGEFEAEAENVLQLLTVMRAAARQQAREHGRKTGPERGMAAP